MPGRSLADPLDRTVLDSTGLDSTGPDSTGPDSTGPVTARGRTARGRRQRAPGHLRDPHLRVPDEHARLRAPGGPARGGRVPARRDGRHARRGRLQHLRGPRERRQPPVRQPGPVAAGQERPSRPADRRGRLPGPEGPGADHGPGALGRRGVRHAQHRLAARAPGAGPGAAAGAGGDRGVAGALPFGAAGPPRVRLLRLGGDLGRLQQHLHVLHRAEPARPRGGPPARRRAGRDPGAGRRRGGRGHAARPERQLLRRRVRRPARVREAAAGLRGDRRPGAGPVHLAASPGLHRRRHRRDGADAERHAAAAHAAAVRLGRRAAGDAARLPPGQVPGHPGQGPRGHPGRRDHHRHHRRIPRRDRERLRRHPRPRAPGPVRRRVHVPVLDPARHPRRDDGRPGAARGGPAAVRAADRPGRGDVAGREPAVRRAGGRGARRRRRGPQGRGDAPDVRPGPRQPAGALRPAAPRGLRGSPHRRAATPGRHGHHRGHPRRAALPDRGRRAAAVRRTRGGDAWAARRESRGRTADPPAARAARCCSACRPGAVPPERATWSRPGMSEASRSRRARHGPALPH